MNLKKSSLIAIAPAAVAVVVAGCGGGGGGGAGAGSGAGAGAYGSKAPVAGAANGMVAVMPSKLGAHLVDSKGRTLYLFEADKTTASTCYSACASIWPPLKASGTPAAGPQVIAAKLGTTKRSDGTTEVTYSGHPLYYYAGDSQQGATAGQGLNQFGGAWYVVAPTGNRIDTATGNRSYGY